MNIVCEIPTEPSVKFTADNETEFNDPKLKEDGGKVE